MVISSSLEGSADFNKFNGFLGTISVSVFGQETSFLYSALGDGHRCHKLKPVFVHLKDTPVMADASRRC